MHKPFIVLIATLGLALNAGCGSQAANICLAQADCEGGNDADVDACIALQDGASHYAAAYDCGEAYAKLIDCDETTSVCVKDKDKSRYNNSCGEQSKALNSCTEAASARR